MDTNQHTTPNICQAVLRLAQANGVMMFSCQLDAGHQGKHWTKYTQTYRQEIESTGHTTSVVSAQVAIPTEIYWDGDSRQEEWLEMHNLLAVHMKNPPSTEQIASWLPAMVSEAKGWALWQTYMGKANQIYKKPDWLGE